MNDIDHNRRQVNNLFRLSFFEYISEISFWKEASKKCINTCQPLQLNVKQSNLPNMVSIQIRTIKIALSFSSTENHLSNVCRLSHYSEPLCLLGLDQTS